ncbi:hypothetical protein TSUD_374030 [Trifolium subterraneum]|uniref:Uncharacterized protein n=1 Tax=Trifolium subterraneum TaxID=3900 RepID=A0A2Z6PA58_TRISU|nr:hypothetical protein TSUD_374030 [Trifolium subterraneum]
MRPKLAFAHGAPVPVVQQALLDAGFAELKLIPLGGDKVLLAPCGQASVASLIQSATALLDTFLDGYKPWSRESLQSYERGAWVRCYGTPVNAWNSLFFAELVSTQGRLLKIEDCSANKVRLDFARLLIATNAMQKVDVTIKVMIDKSVSCIRLVEDDACLVECGEDVDNVSQFSVHTRMQDDDPFIEEFVQDFHEDWNTKMVEASKANSDTVNQAMCFRTRRGGSRPGFYDFNSQAKEEDYSSTGLWNSQNGSAIGS